MWIDPKTYKTFSAHSEIRSEFRKKSLPPSLSDDTIEWLGLLPIQNAIRPEVDHTKNVVEGAPVLQNGAWNQMWIVADATAEEIANRHEQQSQLVRNRRNELLAESDWVVIFHTEKGTNIPLEWELYRQALRDITDHASFPYLQEADWPMKSES